MPGKPHSRPRIRNSEDKLYQSCLDACIEGIANITVDRRIVATSTPSKNVNIKTTTHEGSDLVRKSTPATLSLISPPVSLAQKEVVRHTSPTPLSPSAIIMDRSRYMSAPPATSPGWASGDARSNLAVQPAANAGNLKLKKNAVKIVGAAGTISTIPSRSAPPTPSVTSSPAPGSVKAMPKVVEGPASASTTRAPKPAPLQKEDAVPALTATMSKAVLSTKEVVTARTNAMDEESAMDALYARLNSKTVMGPRTPVGPEVARPDQIAFSFGARLAEAKADKIKTDNPEAKEAETEKGDIQRSPGSKNAELRQDKLEKEYMRKASEYIQALPDSTGNTAYLIKAMSRKLRDSYTSATKIDAGNNEALKARLAFAVANYLNKILKKRPESRTADSIKQTLGDADGDFLRLCARLVEEGYVSLETLTEVSGIVTTMHDILPKPEQPTTTSVEAPSATARSVAMSSENSKLMAKDPGGSIKGWPTQEKRENLAAHRTCILKGVGGITSINQLQALVWGGKLESISMPEPGSSNALVKFLTPEACEKYHKDTANGIEIVGEMKKAVVFVEKAEGPNSINDVIRNCIDGDASRCVRAIGTNEYNEAALMKFARGKSVTKRDVDRIKRGTTARGHSYVEFRFANIYNALNFKRELMDSEDWEHCTIGYASDPCELAKGVHYKDADER